jgi:IclR family acetate operon transcriptional repressor
VDPRPSQEPCQVELARVGGSERILAVLTELARHPNGTRLEELAQSLEMPKSSVHRALATLGRARFAERTERGRYRLGLELVRLALEYYETCDERSIVLPALTTLCDRFGETAHFGRLDGSEIVYVAKVEPATRQARMSSKVGGRNPAHCTSLGKALLAHELPSAEAVEVFVADHAPLTRRTANTLVTAKQLHSSFELIRQRGYATDDEESEEGIVCVALPISLGLQARPAGAISVAALAHRTSLAVLEDAVPEIRRTIAECLGVAAIRS